MDMQKIASLKWVIVFVLLLAGQSVIEAWSAESESVDPETSSTLDGGALAGALSRDRLDRYWRHRSG